MKTRFAILLGVIAAYFIITSDLREFMLRLHAEGLLGVLAAGFFFSSGFTTVPALAVLGLFSTVYQPWLVAIVGGLGATLGDFVLFNISDETVLSTEQRAKKYKWLRQFERTKYFRFAKKHADVIGGIIIASPLPDELAVLLWESARLPPRKFFLWAFIFNTAGIFVIATAARAIL